MSAKESWVCIVFLNFALEEEKEMKLHLKTPDT